MTQLTANFTEADFLNVASRPVSADALSNLQAMADLCQAVVDLCGCPLVITSWYRNALDNSNVGGSSNSQHLNGTAVDLRPLGIDNTPLALMILRAERGGVFPPFGQVITYQPPDHHLHLSLGAKSEGLQATGVGYLPLVPPAAPSDATSPSSTNGSADYSILLYAAAGVLVLSLLAWMVT